MPSPFPGMDPYIESPIWEDFHHRLITAIYDRLSPALPRGYLASTKLFVWRVDNSEFERLILGGPDIHVKETDSRQSSTGVATKTAPLTTILPGVVRKQCHIKIVDHDGRRIVTVIECLSPSNKAGGDDGRAYRLKREEYIASGINLVEIDLLRAGQRPPLGDPPPPLTDYYYLVSRSPDSTRLGIWPFSVRDRLPELAIPLDANVPDISVDLRACIDHVYDCGRFREQLDYTRPPRPPLREPDATWARELLAARRTPAGTGE